MTAIDLDFYRNHGWWVSAPIISDADLDDLQYAFERYAAGERDRELPRAVVPHWSGFPERGVRQGDYLSLQLDEVMRFVLQPVLPSIAGALSETTEIRLFHDQLIWKEPSNGRRTNSAVGWHTDRAYWNTCTSTRMLTAWIPLQDTDDAMGPLAVWDKSHLWSDVDGLHTIDRADLQVAETHFREKGHSVEVRLLPMKRGQVSFHHCRLVHGSYPNRSGKPRLGFAIHYQDRDNQHVQMIDSNCRAVHLNDLLCRRDRRDVPDYRDPDICPVLWRMPG